MTDFAERVKTLGSDTYIGITNMTKMDNWKDAYNYADDLEQNSSDETFLFSAQHKDCVILATVLTALSQSTEKNVMIWRTDDVADTLTSSQEYDINAVNMSASLSLLDWNISESANSFLINGSISNVNTGACFKLLKRINHDLQLNISKIIQKYYNILEDRYLCVFKFDDEQLEKYVRLSKSFGDFVRDDKPEDRKEKIKTIKQKYITEDKRYQYSQPIQSRILTTTSKTENPYQTIILEPNNNESYSRMKNEIFTMLRTQLTSIGGNKIKNKKTIHKKRKNKRKSSKYKIKTKHKKNKK